MITTLPHLKKLDGLEIEKSERIKAFQKIDDIRCDHAPLKRNLQKNFKEIVNVV